MLHGFKWKQFLLVMEGLTVRLINCQFIFSNEKFKFQIDLKLFTCSMDYWFVSG